MRCTDLLLALAITALGLAPAPAGATTLTMENVIDKAPATGAAQPGEPFFTFGL